MSKTGMNNFNFLMNSGRQFPSGETLDAVDSTTLLTKNNETEDDSVFRNDVEKLEQSIRKWQDMNPSHKLTCQPVTKGNRSEWYVVIEIIFQNCTFSVKINQFRLNDNLDEDEEQDEQSQKYTNIIEIEMVDDISLSDIREIEQELSRTWKDQPEKTETLLFILFDKLKARLYKVINSLPQKPKLPQKDFVVYPGGAAINWDSSGHLVVIKNPKIRQFIAQDVSLKMLDQSQIKMKKFTSLLSKERQNTKNQASLRLNKDYLLADSEDNEENVFHHNFAAMEDDENIDSKDYLNFKFDNFHFFPDVMQICTFFADHKKINHNTSAIQNDPNSMSQRRREKIILNPSDPFADKLKKLIFNVQSKKRDNDDDGLSSIYIYDLEKKELRLENGLLEFLNRMIEFGKRNNENEAKYIQFILSEILIESTKDTTRIVRKIQAALERKDYAQMEKISLIGNFLLRNYFNEVIENDPDRQLILAFQAVLFENFISFVRIKNAILEISPRLEAYLKVDSQQLQSMIASLRFDKFSYSQFCLIIFRSNCFQPLQIFKPHEKLDEYKVLNKINVVSKPANRFHQSQLSGAKESSRSYLSKYQIIQQQLSIEAIEPYSILSPAQRSKLMSQCLMISKNWHRRMLFVRERFLQKQIRTNFGIRRLMVQLNSIFFALRSNHRGYLDEFASNCQAYETILGSNPAQECSVCELKVFRGAIVICRTCKHGGHKEHIREWFRTNSHCPKCTICQCYKN